MNEYGLFVKKILQFNISKRKININYDEYANYNSNHKIYKSVGHRDVNGYPWIQIV